MSTIPVHIDQLQLIMDELRLLRAEVSSLNKRLGKSTFTLTEAAGEWDISTMTVRRWIKQGRVRTQSLGGKNIKFSVEEVVRVKNLLLKGFKP